VSLQTVACWVVCRRLSEHDVDVYKHYTWLFASALEPRGEFAAAENCRVGYVLVFSDHDETH